MKTARGLSERCRSNKTWKNVRLWMWALTYESKANEWNEIFPPVKDDRRLFINTYRQVYDAIDSLSDNPNNWICCAVMHEITKESDMMDGILSRFS